MYVSILKILFISFITFSLYVDQYNVYQLSDLVATEKATRQ